MAKFKMNVIGLQYVKNKLDNSPKVLFTKASKVIYETAVEIESNNHEWCPHKGPKAGQLLLGQVAVRAELRFET